MSKTGFNRASMAAIAIASAAVGFDVTSANADAFSVYTGYADSLRPSGFFPGPWIGDPNIVSNSSGAQTFDSGAILIVNTGTTALNISNFSVSNFNDGTVYNFFAPLSIPVGDSGIFTQTSSYNFDSSDNSGNGSPPGGIYPTNPDTNGSNGIGGCSSSAAAQSSAGISGYCGSRAPLVSFMDNSTAYSLSDTGHILDTGNYDFINGSLDGNESINWNLIGSEANRGGTVPEPSTWAMMLLGFSGLGFAGYRKAKAAVLGA